MAAGCDDKASMNRRQTVTSARPPEWRPLVSSRQWLILAQAIGDHPEILDDLRAVLEELSPRVRRALVANLMDALASRAHPTRAIWCALSITGHEVKLSSAVALARLHIREAGAPGAVVRPLRPDE